MITAQELCMELNTATGSDEFTVDGDCVMWLFRSALEDKDFISQVSLDMRERIRPMLTDGWKIEDVEEDHDSAWFSIARKAVAHENAAP